MTYLQEAKLKWFPYYFSKKKIDWVNKNHPYIKIFGNFPYDPTKRKRKFDKIALGDSVTFGNDIPAKNRYCSIVGYENFGVRGLGIDSVYYNLIQIKKLFKPKKIIILLPGCARRLISFKSKGYYFRIPGLLEMPLNDFPFDRDTFWTKKKTLHQLIENNNHKIVKDHNFSYQKKFLKKIAELDPHVMISSWSDTTYNFLPQYFTNILPKFEQVDFGEDGKHPGIISHKKWAKNIQNLL